MINLSNEDMFKFYRDWLNKKNPDEIMETYGLTAEQYSHQVGIFENMKFEAEYEETIIPQEELEYYIIRDEKSIMIEEVEMGGEPGTKGEVLYRHNDIKVVAEELNKIAKKIIEEKE